MTENIIHLINKHGFPIVASIGMGYLIYYVWVWAIKEVKPVLSQSNKTLIELIDRIRVLDNDLIRLNQKVSTVLQLRGKVIESERLLEEHKMEVQNDQNVKQILDDLIK